MQKEASNPKVLFVASNIPTPKRQSNKVVMTIAHKLSNQFDISVLHPAEFAPFPINLMKKYKNIANGQSWEDDGIIVRPFKYIRLFGKKDAFRFLPYWQKRIEAYCKQFGIPQLVHAHYALPDGYFAYQIHKAFHVPYIISFRDADIKLLKQPDNCDTLTRMKLALSNAKQIIVHNTAHKEILSKIGIDSIVMPHGVERTFFQQKQSINSSVSVSITTISELIPRKHVDWVIEAVKNYIGNKNVTLTIAGDGAMRNELETCAKGFDNIIFLGKIEHNRIGDLLSQSDVFALPSVNETFGLVYLEAAAHQNAVVATKDTGIWGVFEDKEEMLFCDSQESFNKLLYRLIEDDDYRNSLAEKAYHKAKENYTWDMVINRYSEIYKNCME